MYNFIGGMSLVVALLDRPLMGIQGKMFMSWHLTVKLIAASPTTGETRDKCIMSAADSMSTTMLFHQTDEAFIRRVLDDTMPPTTHTHMLSTVVCLGFFVFGGEAAPLVVK